MGDGGAPNGFGYPDLGVVLLISDGVYERLALLGRLKFRFRRSEPEDASSSSVEGVSRPVGRGGALGAERGVGDACGG